MRLREAKKKERSDQISTHAISSSSNQVRVESGPGGKNVLNDENRRVEGVLFNHGASRHGFGEHIRCAFSCHP